MTGIFDGLAAGLQLSASRVSAAWFLPFALPISIWVAWKDMATMKIPNRAVLLLAGCFLVTGLVALPLPEYGWRVVQMLIVLLVGFLLNAFAGMGAGDAKFAAAAAGLFAAADARFVMLLLAATMLAALATHRLFRRIGPVRAATPGWVSWTREGHMPLGLALSGTVILYLLLALATGR